MTSSVFFKFKSQKEPSRVEFDGTGISVFELKRDIIVKSGLGDGTDFDLAIYSEDGSEEYDDDTTIIPRSTTVVARRLPPQKPGAGRAARYVSGKMPASAKNSSRRENATKVAKPATIGLSQMSAAMTEEEKMMAMFQAQSDQWTAQQEEMSHQTAVYKPGAKKPANVPDHEPPNGYICYRCGQKGHWIQVCPTNDNPEFDNRPRVKRTTGIPRSFLKTVDKSALQQTGTDGEEVKPPAGVMVNADGEFVIAEPDKASWEQYQAKTKSSSAAQKAASAGDKDLEEKGLFMVPNMMQYPMNSMNGFGQPNMNNMNMAMMMGMNPMMNPMMGMNGMMNPAAFQGMNGNGMFGGNFGGMNEPSTTQAHFTTPNNDNDAYFRKPVNPGRHQNKQRRVRPSDYREL
ncbi:putative RING finger protein P8B7.15c [Daldinia childiae]|uniref:putative RING finger protein P8B7.15c n=1 Tax=Daldinia childiae TaxID=326645 RepID=UPI001447DA05|nr:putative RING finger protein P8B7.15c [Daldinia childiae]KAF3058296.1 putative RING finger protein P8B7.15c [Daldinia childiae]